MKRYSAMILLALFCLGMFSGCARKEPEDTGSTGGNVLSGQTLTQIVDAIYEKHPVELPVGTIPVDLADEYAVNSYLGLQSSENIREAVASESMLGAQAYSLVLCRVAENADTKAIAQQMHDGIDQRKWVCVVADDLKVSAWGDLILLVMISSDYSQSGTAETLTNALVQLCGREPDVQIG